jgi:hypothetical protein
MKLEELKKTNSVLEQEREALLILIHDFTIISFVPLQYLIEELPDQSIGTESAFTPQLWMKPAIAGHVALA